MIKYYCDLCLNEIEGKNIEPYFLKLPSVVNNNIVIKNYQICNDCEKKIAKFVKNMEIISEN